MTKPKEKTHKELTAQIEDGAPSKMKKNPDG